MTDTQTFLSTIPFAGFYESVHSDAVDRALEMMLTDHDTGTESAPSFIWDKAWPAIDYSAVYHEYAKAYAESFLEWLGLGGPFESMTSPRFYNFETDRIFVELTRADLVRLWRMVRVASDADGDTWTRRPHSLTDKAKSRFTSRDGFISHYSPDWRTWGRLSDWDHNQLGTLVAVAAEIEQGADWDQFSEYSLVEDLSGNGFLDEWIWANSGPDLARAVNAWDYLQERAKRPIRTLAEWHAARRAENRPVDGLPLFS